MKSRTYIEYKNRPAKEFTHEDLTKSIFFNQPPILITYPFSSLLTSSLSGLQVTFRLKILFEEINLLNLLGKVTQKIGNWEIEKEENIGKVPFWMLGFLTDSFNENLMTWRNYLIDNLKEFSESSYSQMLWYSITGGGVDTVFKELPLSYERQLWMSINAVDEKNKQAEFMLKIKDSLLPWINPNLYNAVEKKTKETRVNTAYEEVKKKFLSGDYKNLDSIK